MDFYTSLYYHTVTYLLDTYVTYTTPSIHSNTFHLQTNQYTHFIEYLPNTFILASELVLKNQFTQIGLTIILTIIWYFIILVYLYTLFIQFFTLLLNNNTQLIFFKYLVNIITYIEEELTNFNNLLICVILIFNMIFLNYQIFFLQIFKSYFILNIFMQFCLLFSVLLLTPIVLIYNYGGIYIIFLKGETKNQLFSLELIYDYINILSFMIRINIQIMRYIIIFVLFLSYYHLFYEHVSLNNYIISNYLNTTVHYKTLHNLLFLVYYISFELIHCVGIFCIQNTAFILIIFYLIQFLYSVFLYKKLEIFYNKKI